MDTVYLLAGNSIEENEIITKYLFKNSFENVKKNMYLSLRFESRCNVHLYQGILEVSS